MQLPDRSRRRARLDLGHDASLDLVDARARGAAVGVGPELDLARPNDAAGVDRRHRLERGLDGLTGEGATVAEGLLDALGHDVHRVPALCEVQALVRERTALALEVVVDCLVAVLVSKYLFTLFGSLTGPLDDETMFIVPFLAGMFCVLGHIFPIYFGFKGGKGVVTASAMLLMSSYKIFLVTVIVFLLVFAFSKIVSLSAITAALTSAIATFFISYFFENNFHNIWPTLIVCVVVSVIIFRHRENIMRLIRGEEKKASIKKKEKIQEESPGI